MMKNLSRSLLHDIMYFIKGNNHYIYNLRNCILSNKIIHTIKRVYKYNSIIINIINNNNDNNKS